MQMLVQEKSDLKNDFYTAGMLWNESHYGEEEDRCSQSSANGFLFE